MTDTPHNKGGLSENVEFLAGLFAGMPDAILVADAEGNYLDANSAATELLGYTLEELLHMRVPDVVAATSQWVEEEYTRYLAEGNWKGNLELRKKSGELIPTEIRARVIRQSNQTFYVSIIRDITERQRLEASLREQTEVVETVNRLGRLLSAELDHEKLVQAVTDAATELTGARFGSFFYNVIDQNGAYYMLYSLSGVPLEAFAHFPMPRATDLFGPTFLGEGTIRAAEVKKDPRYGKSSPYFGMPPGHLPVTSYLAVPVVSRSGEVIGGLFFGHPEPGMFTERHERIVEGIAAQAAIAMDNARLYQSAKKALAQAEENERHQRFLSDASRVLASSLEYEATLASVARLAVPAFADWCAVDMLQEDGTISRLAVEHIDPKKVEIVHELRRRFPNDPNRPDPLREVLETGEPRWASEIPDAGLEAAFTDLEHLQMIRSLGLKSFIMVPLIARGKTLGAITFVSAESGQAYDSDDLGFAQDLAHRAALAVDNARLYEAARRAVQEREQTLALHRSVEERLSLLVDASDTLIASPVLSEVLPAILSLSSKLISADAYAVWRHSASDGEWRIVSSSGLSDGFQQLAIPASPAVAIGFDSPIVAEDVYTEPILANRNDLHRREGVRSMVVAPLKIAGRQSGTLTFYYREPHRFSELEVRVMTALSNMAAAAITNAELYEEQVRMRDEAEEANRIKDEFLATVSHELRTPLNSIMGWAQILRRGNQESSIPLAVETIERNARSQAQIIDDILDVSRIITGKLRLEVRPLDLTSVIQAAVDTMRPAAEAKGISIQTLLDTDAGQVSGDTNRLQQVVWNLLSNAVKFTPRDGLVQVRLERVNSHVEVAVSDSGKGIRPEFLPHVFERFRQADSSTSRVHGGLGLGLAIVRHLVELHGGTVQAVSEGEGTGATFTVSLPLMTGRSSQSHFESHHLTDEHALSNSILPALEGLRVLIVDDEEDARALLKAMLGPSGAEMKIAASAAEAFEEVKQWRPDIIVSDIGMPGEDGFKFIRRVRALPRDEGGRIPAIALTAYARSEDRVRALASGYQLHVSKPVEVEELATAIASLSGRTERD